MRAALRSVSRRQKPASTGDHRGRCARHPTEECNPPSRPDSTEWNRPISQDGGPPEDHKPVWECLPFEPSTGGTETASSDVTGAGYRHGTKAPPAVSASTYCAARLPMGPGLWSYSSLVPRPCLPC